MFGQGNDFSRNSQGYFGAYLRELYAIFGNISKGKLFESCECCYMNVRKRRDCSAIRCY